MFLHIVADHDENGLNSELYPNLDEFVAKHSESFTTFAKLDIYINRLKEGLEDEDEDGAILEKDLHRLITKGCLKGEWSDSEFYEIKGESFVVSLGKIDE